MLKIWARSAQLMVSPPKNDQERHGSRRGVRRFLGLGKEKGMGFNRYAGALLASAGHGTGLGLRHHSRLTCRQGATAGRRVLICTPLFDVSFKNAYITPRGLLRRTRAHHANPRWDIGRRFKSKTGHQFGHVYGYAERFERAEALKPHSSPWNEFDWAVGMIRKFAQNWKFGIEYVEFLSPPGNFSIERNIEFTLAYDDSSWWGGGPFTLNPYVKLFYAVSSGSSTVVTGKAGDTYDVEIGIVPTLDMKRYLGIPRVIRANSVTVGPSGTGILGNLGCGGALTLCSTDNVGVFSTGLTAKLALDWVPARYGKWYAKAGFQYFDFLNDNLQRAQQTTLNTNFAGTHKDYVVGFGGLGFSF